MPELQVKGAQLPGGVVTCNWPLEQLGTGPVAAWWTCQAPGSAIQAAKR